MTVDQNRQGKYRGSRPNKSRPNFLIIMVDEERYPPVYETPEITAWRQENLPAHELLRRHSIEFVRQTTAAGARRSGNTPATSTTRSFGRILAIKMKCCMS